MSLLTGKRLQIALANQLIQQTAHKFQQQQTEIDKLLKNKDLLV